MQLVLYTFVQETAILDFVATDGIHASQAHFRLS